MTIRVIPPPDPREAAKMLFLINSLPVTERRKAIQKLALGLISRAIEIGWTFEEGAAYAVSFVDGVTTTHQDSRVQ